ncbi:MAG: hypothetical protein ACK4UO_08705 [Pseudolabrys sp.]
MSTLPLRAPNVPALPATGLARAVAALLLVIDVFAEAQAQARVAHKQYPFADW